MEDLIGVFGRLHPVLNHLPIGLLVGLLAIEVVAAAIASPLPRRVITGLVWITAIAAVLSALSGWVLAREDQYGTIDLHRWLGTGIAALTCVLALIHLRAREGTRETGLKAYRALLVLAVVLLVPTGHLGGTITHGEGFLTAPLREREVVEAAARAPTGGIEEEPAAIEYARDVAPILADRCGACHGNEKKKGGLSLADRESILEGGWEGPVLVAGSSAESELVRRLRLPIDDEDHMPPESKPQPTPAEIDLLAAWIDAGARFDGEAPAAPAPEPEPPAVVPPPEPPPPSGPSEEDLARLRAALVHVAPVAQGDELLWIDFAAAAGTTGDAEARALLEPVREHVVDLSLARTAITDAALELVARMPKLSRLDLRETAVTDAGVARLAGHPSLSELVMPRTKLTDAAVPHLLRIPSLRRVFLWNSGVTIRGIAELRLGREDLAIEAGDPGDARPLESDGGAPSAKPEPAAGTTPAPPPAPPLAPSNATCPVSGKPVDPAYQVVYRGRVIAFCCPNCPTTFWAEPEKYAPR